MNPKHMSAMRAGHERWLEQQKQLAVEAVTKFLAWSKAHSDHAVLDAPFGSPEREAFATWTKENPMPVVPSDTQFSTARAMGVTS